MVGKRIRHTWEDDGQESQWYGRFIATFKKPSAKRHQTKVIIAYWDKDSIESQAEEYDFSLDDVLTDIILEDISFI